MAYAKTKTAVAVAIAAPACTSTTAEEPAPETATLSSPLSALDREVDALSDAREMAYLNCVYRTRASAERLPALVEEVTQFHAGWRSRCASASRCSARFSW